MKQHNRIPPFFRRLPARIWLLLLAVVVLAFFSNDFGLVDIQKTAIILATGIDRNQTGYRMTAQIAVPKGTDRTTGGTSSVEIKADGETIADCVADIYCKTGWVPKFVFCNLLLIGEEAAQQNVFDALDYFLRNEYMPDSSFLAVCKGRAEEMLSSESAIDDTSSLAITRLFSDATVKAGKAMKTSLKEFSISYHGPSKSGFMPYVMPYEQEGANGGNGQNGESKTKQNTYCAERTALFYEGKMTALLSPEQTFAFSLLKGEVKSGYFLTQEEGKSVSLTVLEDKGEVKLNTKNTPKTQVKLDLTVRLFNRAAPSEIADITNSIVSDELLESSKLLLQEQISSVFETCKESGCDLFELRRALYRSSPKKYGEWKEQIPSLPVEYDVKLKSAK